MSIIFLNTLEQIEQSITTAWEKLGVQESIEHINRPLLLEQSREGVELDELIELIAVELETVKSDDLVVCTCSSLGHATELWGQRNDVQVVRIDRAMMYKVVRTHDVVGLVYTTESTVRPSQKLLLEEANRAGRFVKVELVDATEAWEFIETDKDKYLSVVAEKMKSFDLEVEAFVLAQGSTSGVVDLLPQIQVPIYSSVEVGLRSVVELVNKEVV